MNVENPFGKSFGSIALVERDAGIACRHLQITVGNQNVGGVLQRGRIRHFNQNVDNRFCPNAGNGGAADMGNGADMVMQQLLQVPGFCGVPVAPFIAVRGELDGKELPEFLQAHFRERFGHGFTYRVAGKVCMANCQTRCKACSKYTSLRCPPLQTFARAVIQRQHSFPDVLIRILGNILMFRKIFTQQPLACRFSPDRGR